MSNHYATIISDEKKGFPKESKFMYVTAFMGDGKAVQLTTEIDYITLTEKQVKDLINILEARLYGKVTATNEVALGEFRP